MFKKQILIIAVIILLISGALITLHILDKIDEMDNEVPEISEPVDLHYILGDASGNSPVILRIDNAHPWADR